MPTPNGPLEDTRPLFFGAGYFPTTVGYTRCLIRSAGPVASIPSLEYGIVLNGGATWHDDSISTWNVGWDGVLGSVIFRAGAYWNYEHETGQQWQVFAIGAIPIVFEWWYSGASPIVLPRGTITFSNSEEGEPAIFLTPLSEWVDVREQFPLATLSE